MMIYFFFENAPSTRCANERRYLMFLIWFLKIVCFRRPAQGSMASCAPVAVSCGFCVMIFCVGKMPCRVREFREEFLLAHTRKRRKPKIILKKGKDVFYSICFFVCETSRSIRWWSSQLLLRTRQRRSMAFALVMVVGIYRNFDAFSRPQSAVKQADWAFTVLFFLF